MAKTSTQLNISLAAYLYETIIGRVILKFFVRPQLSILIGKLLSSNVSRIFIPLFVNKNNINKNKYVKKRYTSFNDFFIRKLREQPDPAISKDGLFYAPCEGHLLVKPINKEHFTIKKAHYSLSRLLDDDILAQEFEGGIACIFRLTPKHYHRFHYFEDGKIIFRKKIGGKLHTVQPIAMEHLPVFHENSRELTVMETRFFGKVIQIEVGAMLIGRIKNHAEFSFFSKFEEKGYFEFGGSMIILLFKKNHLKGVDTYLSDSKRNIESPIEVFQVLGRCSS
ncbi:phosphatidylserine decarboxylase [Enterococcus sp. 8G7_MSG3316]|uniref:Phosphatidylserine decarboxylase n=1 Tax=Candidatus Enterococcus testudinis TaxID=1834191 RepID=A0A242A776_9ENTE|nr:phosphatidylserine decarboxylase [Enterococcus sp. 8G7_MSG3316]OTN76463.1 phosphatidylserine decarboxylase [Enterococcus sp. 8G7_MSG3316]